MVHMITQDVNFYKGLKMAYIALIDLNKLPMPILPFFYIHSLKLLKPNHGSFNLKPTLLDMQNRLYTTWGGGGQLQLPYQMILK